MKRNVWVLSVAVLLASCQSRVITVADDQQFDLDDFINIDPDTPNEEKHVQILAIDRVTKTFTVAPRLQFSHSANAVVELEDSSRNRVWQVARLVSGTSTWTPLTYPREAEARQKA